MVILNTGLDEATVIVTALREASVAKQFVVPAGSVMEFSSVEGNADGVLPQGRGSFGPDVGDQHRDGESVQRRGAAHR
jgi:hypothetical protein